MGPGKGTGTNAGQLSGHWGHGAHKKPPHLRATVGRLCAVLAALPSRGHARLASAGAPFCRVERVSACRCGYGCLVTRFELSTPALREEAAQWLQGMGYLVRPRYDWSPTSLVVLGHDSDVEDIALVVRRVDPRARRAEPPEEGRSDAAS